MTVTKSPIFTGECRRVPVMRFLWGQRDLLGLMHRLAREPGDVDLFKIGRRTIALLKHPDLVQQVLVADGAKTEKGRTQERARFFRFLGDGLLNIEGAGHRRQRRLVLPAFHRARLGGYGQVMVDSALNTVAAWKDGEERDLVADMTELTLTVVARTLFSSDVKGTGREIADSFNEMSANINRLMFPGASLLLNLPLPFVAKIDEAQQRLDDIVYALIRERRAQGTDTGDLLSMLLLAEDAEAPGERLTDLEVRDQVMTMFFAGHETTANALTWIFWLLAQHPEIEKKLHEEVDRVLAGRDAGFADLPQLALTEQIVREAMRLYPPVWTMGRKTTADVTLGQCTVPPESLIVVSQWVMHRDPRWYSEPDRFQPERWTPAFRAALPRFAYFPFGGGARSCIGENFAWMEFILIVATIARRWRFGFTDAAAKVKPLARITLHPDRAVPLRLHKR